MNCLEITWFCQWTHGILKRIYCLWTQPWRQTGDSPWSSCQGTWPTQGRRCQSWISSGHPKILTIKMQRWSNMDGIEEITGCISSCRFFRFSSTNSYSLVLSTNQLLGKLNFLFGKTNFWRNLKLSWIRWWFTWRSGEQLVSGASSGPPWNI